MTSCEERTRKDPVVASCNIPYTEATSEEAGVS